MTGSQLRHVSVGGFELALRDLGRGTPLVLLHGFPFDARMWSHQVAALSEHCRVLAPDLRGHGASDAPPAPYRMLDFAEDIRALLDALDLDRVVLAGLSMGGYIALAFAERYPERLAALGLLATRADQDSDIVRRGRHLMSAQVQREGVASIAPAMVDTLAGGRAVDPAVVESIRTMILGTSVEGIVGSQAAMATRADTLSGLGALRCPSLVLVGTADELTPPELAHTMAAELTDCELVEVAGAGHVVAMESPGPVNTALSTLVDRAG